MPIVMVNIKEGRTVEQKRAMVTKMTDVLCETHGHFLCQKCGKLFDIPVDEEAIFKTATAANNDIAQIEHTEIFFYGMCTACLKI